MSETKTESKAELVARWRREGREEEASRFREQVRQASLEKGLSRQEANRTAWAEAARNFPPLPPDEVSSVNVLDAPDTRPDDRAENAPAVVSSEIPWQDLPDEADYETEVRWAYQQFAFVVKESPGARSVLKWEQASRQPPSRGAVAMLRFGATNQAKFLGDIVPKILGGQGDGDGDAESVRRERASLAEMESLLDQMNAKFAQEMADNAPEAVRERVESVVDDWIREFGIDESHRNALVGRACRLATDCVEAALDASGRD